MFDEKLRRRSPPPPSGNVHIRNLYRQEELKVNIYNRDGSYNTDALKQLSHLLRCKRTDTETPMEPRLFTILSHVYDHFGERRIELTSGYRNQRKTTSNHYRGSASDIMVPGVPPKVCAPSSRAWTPAASASASTRSAASSTSTSARPRATAGSTTRPPTATTQPPPQQRLQAAQAAGSVLDFDPDRVPSPLRQGSPTG